MTECTRFWNELRDERIQYCDIMLRRIEEMYAKRGREAEEDPVYRKRCEELTTLEEEETTVAELWEVRHKIENLERRVMRSYIKFLERERKA